jgi:HEAT repeats
MNEPNALTDPTRPSSNGPPAQEHALPPLPDLPPVEAPSGAFIVQLFVIPAVVVFVVILVWLLFGKLAGGERDAMEYVRLIRESSTNWRAANRAAYELASLIQNDPKLASDPRLVGELTDVLEHDLSKVENPEMTQYVALALGRFQTLDAVTAHGQKVDPLATLSRAVQGATYPPEVRLAAATSLAQQAARVEGKLDDPAAVGALAEAGKTGEPALRQRCVFALGFFGGEPAAQALRERLGDDDRLTRYNAAVALARRGDPAALAVTREMLSTAELDKLLTDTPPAERQSLVETIHLQALAALQSAVDAGNPDLARSVRLELDALTRSGLADVRNKSQALLRFVTP